ncbi:MAG: response regulator transcription factor [Deltaproteobacteria bacterium]|nr:response regulator transcription factor [Deltaproteobacteria bacterium]
MVEPRRILIADDEESFLYSTADILRREGYDCSCASDARAATEMLRKDSYDLLIADIKMQGNSDLEFIKALPQIAEGMPVILVTGYPSLNSAIESVQLPVVAYLVKPFELNELLVRVKDVITGKGLFKTRRLEKALQKMANDLEEVGALTGANTSTTRLYTLNGLHALTQREWEILRLLRANQRVVAIARSLHISTSTVRNHIKSIFQKMGVHSQMELLECLSAMTEQIEQE